MIATQSPLIEDFKKLYQKKHNNIIPTDERKKAWEHFEKVGLPTKKTEDYKFIPVTRLLEKNIDFAKLSTSTTDTKAEIVQKSLIEGTSGYRIVLVNGILDKNQSDFPANVTIEKLEDASDEVNTHIGNYVRNNEDPFVALNTAVADDGFFIRVAKNSVLDKPLFIYNIVDTSQQQIHLQTRNIILLEENSEAEMVLINKGFGDQAAFYNEVNEILMEQNARFTWTRLQDEADNHYHINNTAVYQEKDAHFHSVTVSLSGGLLRNNLEVALDGSGCEANLYGLCMVEQDHIVDNHTVVDHKKPHADSNELYKGILFDKAKGVFNGRIYVRPDAQQTNAFQSNKNILLSPDATVNTKPQLEIWADDVKCSHGCTTGQLDEEALFYLQARGINKKLAKALLLQAFAGEVLQQIKQEKIREHIEEFVNERLGV